MKKELARQYFWRIRDGLIWWFYYVLSGFPFLWALFLFSFVVNQALSSQTIRPSLMRETGILMNIGFITWFLPWLLFLISSFVIAIGQKKKMHWLAITMVGILGLCVMAASYQLGMWVAEAVAISLATEKFGQ